MLTLRVLGGLSLTDSERSIPARATQRRRLALLSILAAAQERTTSRDQLLALLWPDADREHARHVLSDSLYVLRDALGEDVLSVTGDLVALNPARLTSDVMEFRRTLEAGDLRGAVEIYGARGAFLDGVHLVDSVEFERWVDTERGRLAAEYTRALHVLASEAEGRGDRDGAVAWRRRLAVEDRLSSSAALALMRALADAGDVPGAVALARVHASIVNADLDCAPDPRIVAFAEELRVRAAVATPVPEGRRGSPPIPEIADAASAAPPATPVPAPGTASSRRATRRAPALVLGALGLGAIIYGATTWPRASARAVTATRPLSVAVATFTDVGGDSADRSFTEGLTENLVNALARSRDPRVVARPLASTTLSRAELRRLGESLHVALVIEGEAHRAGERIQVGVRLIDVSDGYTRWAGSFERDSRDVLALQDEIGRAVVAALRPPERGGAPASRARHGTTSLEAYDLYLRGRYGLDLRSDTGFRAAVQAYRSAIGVDSTFAAAYAGLAQAYALTGVAADYDSFPPRETALKAEAAARKAVALDDSLAEAHLALGIVRLLGPIDWGEAEREFTRAQTLDAADPRVREFLSGLYGWTGRPAAAVREARALVDADSLSASALRELGRALYMSRRYDEALAQLERARTVGAPVRVARRLAGEIYTVRHQYPEAIAAFRTRPDPYARAMLGYALARSGDTTSARRMLDDFIVRDQQGRGGAFEVAIVYAGLRDYAHTFDWLNKSVEDHSIRGDIMSPMFDEIRADPRFAPVHRMLVSGAARGHDHQAVARP